MHAIEARFRSFRREMPEINVRQAMVPEGAEALDNPRGTAPGLWIEQGDRIIVLLPGPPREMRGIFESAVGPRLARLATGVRLFHRELRVTGLGESHVEQRIAPIYKRYDDVNTTVLAAPGEVQVHLRLWSDRRSQRAKKLDEIERGFDIALTDRIFSRDGEPLHEVVARELTLNHSTIAVAESCTGGLLAQRLTSIAGSSSYFLGGVVCYSNELKTAWADVPPELIAAKGAVSRRGRRGAGRRDSAAGGERAGRRRDRNRRAGRGQRGKTGGYGACCAGAQRRSEGARGDSAGRPRIDPLASFATGAGYGANAFPVQWRRVPQTFFQAAGRPKSEIRKIGEEA